MQGYTCWCTTPTQRPAAGEPPSNIGPTHSGGAESRNGATLANVWASLLHICPLQPGHKFYRVWKKILGPLAAAQFAPVDTCFINLPACQAGWEPVETLWHSSACHSRCVHWFISCDTTAEKPVDFFNGRHIGDKKKTVLYNSRENCYQRRQYRGPRTHARRHARAEN